MAAYPRRDIGSSRRTNWLYWYDHCLTEMMVRTACGTMSSARRRAGSTALWRSMRPR